MKLLGMYKNGNFVTKIFEDGTKIRETKFDTFSPSFAENMDIKITDCCDIGCQFCHEGSSLVGKHGDILNEKFIDTLHPFQEVAIGGGNALSHPDLLEFLMRLKQKKVIANITVHQRHFEQNYDFIRYLIEEKLVYGIGISLVEPTDEFIKLVKQFPNAVIHVINGIFNITDYQKLKDHGLKILILGYKQIRRGHTYNQNHGEEIGAYQRWLKVKLPDVIKGFDVVSFDNLAIDQLNVRDFFSDEEWEEFYMGDDGSMTFYIDMVNRKFARSSTAPFEKRYELLDSVDEMFRVIKEEV